MSDTPRTDAILEIASIEDRYRPLLDLAHELERELAQAVSGLSEERTQVNVLIAGLTEQTVRADENAQDARRYRYIRSEAPRTILIELGLAAHAYDAPNPDVLLDQKIDAILEEQPK